LTTAIAAGVIPPVCAVKVNTRRPTERTTAIHPETDGTQRKENIELFWGGLGIVWP
jgi:hypothetical protein